MPTIPERLETATAALEAAVGTLATGVATATTKATEAATSATAASGSATTATTKAADAETARAAAVVAKTAAETAQTAAGGSATAAAGSATAASTSQTAAATSATNAGNSATAAAGSATTAGTQATNAANSATAAATSATNAANSATAAAASNVAASTHETNAATQATNAGTSATSAAASATLAAAIAAGLVYVSDVAGNAVPATATAAGYCYLINAAGTSQSITWAAGDLAIYKGTSGQWSKIAGVLTNFTGIRDATNQRATIDFMMFDGLTSGARVYWPLGSAGAIGADDFTVVMPAVEIPTANLQENGGLFVLSSSNSGYANPGSAPWSFICNLGTDGALRVRIGSDTNNRFGATATSFVSSNAGKTVPIVVRRVGAVLTMWVNGVSVTITEATNGTAPAWSDSVLSDYLVQGVLFSTSRFKGAMAPVVLINGAMSDAEIIAHAQSGQLPRWAALSTGSQVAIIGGSTRNGNFETLGAGGADVFASWSEALQGGTTSISAETTIVDSGTYAAKISVDAAGNYGMLNMNSVCTVGKRYRAKFRARDDGTSARCSLFAGNALLTGGQYISQPLTNVWTTYTVDFTAVDSIIQIGNNRGINDANKIVYIDNVELYELGPICKPVVQPIPVIADAGLNKTAGVVTSGVTLVTNKRDWVIQGQTSTNGNQQLLGASVFFDFLKHMLDSIETNGASTATVSIGNASGGAQYKASAAIVSGRNRHTLATPITATNNIWVASNTTDVLQHTIRGHLVD